MEKPQIEKAIRPVLEELRNSVYLPEYRKNISDHELIGILISKFFEWSGADILSVTEYALEDSNFHDLAGTIGDMRDDLQTGKN